MMARQMYSENSKAAVYAGGWSAQKPARSGEPRSCRLGTNYLLPATSSVLDGIVRLHGDQPSYRVEGVGLDHPVLEQPGRRGGNPPQLAAVGQDGGASPLGLVSIAGHQEAAGERFVFDPQCRHGGGAVGGQRAARLGAT